VLAVKAVSGFGAADFALCRFRTFQRQQRVYFEIRMA
jgi:hypothetical protein